MKRSTTNRRTNQSATVESLETRRMFCFAPLSLPIYEVMDNDFVREQAQLRDGPPGITVDRTAGERSIGSDNVQN